MLIIRTIAPLYGCSVKKKLKDVFRDVLFHRDILCDREDIEEHLCVSSHGSKSRGPFPRFLLHPPVALRFRFSLRWDSAGKLVSVKTVSRGTNPSILSWETRAGGALASPKIRSSPNFSYPPFSFLPKRGTKKKI